MCAKRSKISKTDSGGQNSLELGRFGDSVMNDTLESETHTVNLVQQSLVVSLD